MSAVAPHFAAHACGAAVGMFADRFLPEPPNRAHPVAWFGRSMGALEGRIYRDNRLAGAAFTAVGVAAGWTAGVAVEQVAKGVLGKRRPLSTALLATSITTTVAVAGSMLGDTGTRIAEALPADYLPEDERASADSMAKARALLPALVGRDATTLNATGVARAVTESVAENTVDAVIAPALCAALFGAPGVLAYRAINTMDAMVGHHSTRYEHFGWASARLDDVANFVPARVTAGLVALVRPHTAREVHRAVRDDAPAHPSPNSGVAEAAFAAAIERQLGGVNVYGDRIEDRGTLGKGAQPDVEGVRRAVDLLRDVTLAFAAMLLVASAIAAVAVGSHERGPR